MANKSFTPKIIIDMDSGEADVDWGRFNELDSLMKADLLGDLQGIFAGKYNEAIQPDTFMKDIRTATKEE